MLIVYDQLSGVSPKAIAIQSPYVAQVQLLRESFHQIPETRFVEVATIDSFQGREADAVIISMVNLISLTTHPVDHLIFLENEHITGSVFIQMTTS